MPSRGAFKTSQKTKRKQIKFNSKVRTKGGGVCLGKAMMSHYLKTTSLILQFTLDIPWSSVKVAKQKMNMTIFIF